jgi:hypothetical protein
MEKYLPCMLCGKRRIKPTRKYASLGSTQIVHIGEGMCKRCAWEKINLKCKICGEIITKGYPRLLAHTTAHYTTSELLSNEEAEQNVLLINLESSKNSNAIFSKNGNDNPTLQCKICGNNFIFKKEDIIFSRWIDHIKSHYTDKDLIKKERIAKNLVYLNYNSVIQVSIPQSHINNGVSSSSITYRELTKREADAYVDALYRIRTEESITKSKGR